MSGNETLPKVPPTLDEFIPLLARLGGISHEKNVDSASLARKKFASLMDKAAGTKNNRRTKRPPGPQTIWIGLQRMNAFAQAWLAFNKQQQVVYN